MDLLRQNRPSPEPTASCPEPIRVTPAALTPPGHQLTAGRRRRAQNMALADAPNRARPSAPAPAGSEEAEGVIEGFGFGGAPVRLLEQIAGIARPGDVVFFGVDSEFSRQFGTGNPGAARFIRDQTASMMPWTRIEAAACHDIGIITATDPQIAMRETIAVATYLASLSFRPCLIGCDHTASFANLLGVTSARQDEVTYLYFDAHYDLGLHNAVTSLHNGNFVRSLLDADGIKNVVNIGGRSWSTYDPIYSDLPGFTGIRFTNMANILAVLKPLQGQPVYVSIDADVLDPSCAPYTPCPEPFGLSTRELLEICTWIGQNAVVTGADMSELMPTSHSFGTEHAILRCLHALFVKPARSDR